MYYKENKTPGLGPLLNEEELRQIEQSSPAGFTSAEIVDIFARRGVRFSEATFRKYVQLGLLPRSRRVGTKGKHKGSRGIYPVGTVRQVNEIKKMMSFDYTIEEIREQFAFIGGELEELRNLALQIIERLEQSIPRGDKSYPFETKGLLQRIGKTRGKTLVLVSELEEISRAIQEQARTVREAI